MITPLRTAFVTLTAVLCLASTAQPRYLLRLQLKAGQHLVEHRYCNDRIEWKLPKKRLEPFIRAGVVIKEERHAMTSMHATVTRVHNGAAVLSGDASMITIDVPRRSSHQEQGDFTNTITLANDDAHAGHLHIQDAAMAGLPSPPLRLGECWSTRRAVTTALGSGVATLRHCLDSRSGNVLRILVHGSGQITGKEYHLPKLLPGSILLDGAAWYDLSQGLVTQESYRIHNRLLKPAENEYIGFDEILDVDISTRRY